MEIFRNSFFTYRHWVQIGSVVAVALVWILVEFQATESIYSVRLGFTVGLLSFPGLIWIYDYGLVGEGGIAAMGLSFFYKAGILFGTLMGFQVKFNISFRHYIFSLFFTIFCLGFVAIYLARIRSEHSFNSN